MLSKLGTACLRVMQEVCAFLFLLQNWTTVIPYNQAALKIREL